MKVLITGITGLLGSLVAVAIYKAGHQVIGVSRRSSTSMFDFPVEMKALDLTKLPLNESLLDNIDVVIHCAADTSMGSLPNQMQSKLNEASVQNLVDLAIRSKIQRFILVSSANTIVPGTKSKPGIESNKMQISTSNLNYVNSKIKAEAIVLEGVKKKGLKGIILNPTFILSPQNRKQSSNKLLNYGLNNSILFCPTGGKNFVDGRDVSHAIVSAIDKGQIGENYIISNKNYTYKEFFQLIVNEQNRKAKFLTIPAWTLRSFGRISSMVERLFRRPANFNRHSAQFLNSNHFYDHSKASNHLGYAPRPIVETIKEKITQSEK